MVYEILELNNPCQALNRFFPKLQTPLEGNQKMPLMIEKNLKSTREEGSTKKTYGEEIKKQEVAAPSRLQL